MAHAREWQATGSPDKNRGRAAALTAKRSRPESAAADQPPSGIQLEQVVSWVLKVGSYLSVALMLLGIALMVWSSRGTAHTVAMPRIAGLQTLTDTPSGLIRGAERGDPNTIISLGLLALIATPVARVASTVVYFWWKKDRTYLAITSFVLLVLLIGFAVGTSE